MTSRRRSAAPVAAMLLVLAVLTGNGCGDRSGEVRLGPALDGQTFDALSIAATSAGPGAAVLVGGSATEAGPDPRPVLWWIESEEAPPEPHVLPVDGPLFDVEVWWTGVELAVAGLPCGRWTDARQAPDAGDDGAPFLADLCGTDRYDILAWSPETGVWRTIPGAQLRAEDGIALLDVDGELALVRSVDVDDGAPVERNGRLSLLDLERGVDVAIPPAPTPAAGDPDSTFTVCSTGGTTTAMLVWEGAEPDSVARGEFDGELAAVVAPSRGRRQHVLPFGLRDGRWVPLRSSSGAVGALGSPICVDQGILVANATAAAVMRASSGTEVAEWVGVGELPGHEWVVLPRAQPGSGPPLAIALLAPADGRAADAPIDSPAWLWSSGRWSSLGTVPYHGGWRGVTLGTTVIGLDPAPGRTAQGEVRVVLP